MKNHIVAAFCGPGLRGNPAGVSIVPAGTSTAAMQGVAARLAQPETAFLSGAGQHWSIRWFSPETEVDLCGHATLASAAVLWASDLAGPAPIYFTSPRDNLIASRDAQGMVWLDFPANSGVPMTVSADLAACVGTAWIAASRHDDRVLLELADAQAVRDTRPDFAQLRQTGVRSLIVTARADQPDFDIISRNFAPIVGVNEDQATGSAHACLAPYWQDRLGDELVCLQASPRGGLLRTALAGSRLSIGGEAIIELAELSAP